MKRLLIIINKQKIFLDKIKRTGSNLKKRANFTRIVFKLVFNLSSVGVTNSNSYQRSSTANECVGLVLLVPYARKEKSITFSSFFHTIKVRKF